MAKVKYIRGVLRSVSSQRLQYKPYGYELSFKNPLYAASDQGLVSPAVVVEMEIPADLVVEEVEGYVVIGLEGLNAILEAAADSLDKLNEKYKKKLQGGK